MEARYSFDPPGPDILEDDDLAERLNAAYEDEEPDIDKIVKGLAEWEVWYAEQVAGE